MHKILLLLSFLTVTATFAAKKDRPETLDNLDLSDQKTNLASESDLEEDFVEGKILNSQKVLGDLDPEGGDGSSDLSADSALEYYETQKNLSRKEKDRRAVENFIQENNADFDKNFEEPSGDNELEFFHVMKEDEERLDQELKNKEGKFQDTQQVPQTSSAIEQREIEQKEVTEIVQADEISLQQAAPEKTENIARENENSLQNESNDAVSGSAPLFN